MFNDRRILIFLITFICICTFGAVSANSPTTNDTVPVNINDVFDGSLNVNMNATTAKVGDNVAINVIITNTGLCDWENVELYMPIPSGLEFESFAVPGITVGDYNPITGLWNVNQMSIIGRGSEKEGIITCKVLPEAANNNITINAGTVKFISLTSIFNGTQYNIVALNMSPVDLRTSLLEVEPITGKGNSTSNGNGTYSGSVKPTATADPMSGLYNTNKLVKLSMNKQGTIYYTINGNIPTNTSKKYIGPIDITSTTQLKFIAIDAAHIKSPVYTATYIIDKLAPKIISSNPKDNANLVSLTSPITINFSEKILKGSDYSNIQIKNMNTHKIVSITKTVSGNKLTIKMTRSRLSQDTYQIYIPKGAIKDNAGNTNNQSIIQFKTRRY